MVKKNNENLFEYLGRKQREDKERKIKIEDKYWNLSPIERIDYDNKKERINKKGWGFPLTIGMLKIVFGLAIIVVLLYFLADTPKQTSLLEMVGTPLILAIKFIFNLLGFFIICDVLANYILKSFKKRCMIELNKRFKLCQ